VHPRATSSARRPVHHGVAVRPSVSATTAWGTPALDLPAAVRAALAAEDVTMIDVRSACTGCDDRYWSHRRRGERARHGMAVWLEAA
jgi:copper oxidase (laccase) domain-containing protein